MRMAGRAALVVVSYRTCCTPTPQGAGAFSASLELERDGNYAQ